MTGRTRCNKIVVFDGTRAASRADHGRENHARRFLHALRRPGDCELLLNFFVSIRVNSWFNFENETVAFVHFARRRHGVAAGLWPRQTGAARRRRAQISAQLRRRRRAHAARHGVVRLEREQRTHRGFFRVQALHDGGLHGGRRAVVHLHPGFSGGARTRRGDAAAGEN